MKNDLSIARQHKVNVVFSPNSDEIYPAGYSTFIEEERLSKKLCGQFRVGHFRGVSTVVAKLFNVVRPHTVVFGQKDAQQVAVIKKMIADLNYPVHLVVIPTIREKNGLACSSRNEYLSAREKKEAAQIYASLQKAAELVKSGVGDATKIVSAVKGSIAQAPLVEIEYVEAVNPDTLEPVKKIDARTLIAVAARVGKARLIDNVIVEP
jgi:pantoate--beta-alanine ligase